MKQFVTSYLFTLAFLAQAQQITNIRSIINESGSAWSSGEPVTMAVAFRDRIQSNGRCEITNYPQPYQTNGTPITPWQFDREMRHSPSGCLQWGLVSFSIPTTVANNAKFDVEFRNSSPARCNLANNAACDAAGLSRAGMLAYASGTWQAKLSVQPYPNTDSANTSWVTAAPTTRVIDARTLLGDSAGRCPSTLLGPVVTERYCGNFLNDDLYQRDKTRPYFFGWRNTREAGRLEEAGWNSSATTSFKLSNASNLPATPFYLYWDYNGEITKICNVNVGTRTYSIGDSTCPNVDGHSQFGSSVGAGVYYGTSKGHYPMIYDPAKIVITNPRGSSGNSDGSPGVVYSYTNRADFSSTAGVTDSTPWFLGKQLARPSGVTGSTVSFHHTASFGSNSQQELSSPAGSLVYFQGGPNVPAWKLTDQEWIDDTITPALDPEVVVRAYTGWNSMGHTWSLGNTYMDRFRDQWYTVTVQSGVTGSISDIETYTAVWQHAKTRLRYPSGPNRGDFNSTVSERQYWTSTKPAPRRYALNAPSFYWSGLVPIPPGLANSSAISSLTSTGVVTHSNGNWPAWNNTNQTKCAPITGDYGNIGKSALSGHWGAFFLSMWASGQRPELGPETLQFATLFANMDAAPGTSGLPDLWKLFHSIPACEDQLPVFYSESSNSTSLKLCSMCSENTSTDAFGFPVSVTAKPDISLSNFGEDNNYAYAGSYTETFYQMQPGDLSGHFPRVGGNYILTGDVFDRRNAEHYGTWPSAANFNETPNTTSSNPRARLQARNGSDGQIGYSNGPRTRLKGIAMVLKALRILEPGSPIFSAVKHVARANVIAEQGRFNVRVTGVWPGNDTCASPTAQTDAGRWCLGHVAYAGRDVNVGKFKVLEPKADFSGDTNYLVTNRARDLTAQWGQDFIDYAIGDACASGLEQYLPGVCALFTAVIEYRAHMLANPAVKSHDGLHQENAIAQVTCLPEGVDDASCSSRTYPPGTQMAFSNFKNYMDSIVNTRPGKTAAYLSPYGYYDNFGTGEGMVDRVYGAMAGLLLLGPVNYNYSEPIGPSGATITGTINTRAGWNKSRLWKGFLENRAAQPSQAREGIGWRKITATLSGTTVTYKRPLYATECRWSRNPVTHTTSNWTLLSIAATGVNQTFATGSNTPGDQIMIACGYDLGEIIVP